VVDDLTGAQAWKGDVQGREHQHRQTRDRADGDGFRLCRCPASFEDPLQVPEDVPRLRDHFLTGRCGARSGGVSVEQAHAAPSLQGG